MPEGPEVYSLHRYIAENVDESKKIIQASVVSGRYTRTPIKGLERLVGARILNVSCKGKLITLLVANSGKMFSVHSTLGMTGYWVFNPTREVRNTRLKILFDDGTEMVYVDQRNFGTFTVLEVHESQKKSASLGADIVEAAVTASDEDYDLFLERFNRYGKRVTVAEALLDQRIAAGSGNYIRAEAMYIAGVDPRKPADMLPEEKIKAIWDALKEISLASLTNKHAYREGQFEFMVFGRKTSFIGEEVSSYRDKDGRTVWYVPSVQTQ